VWGRGRQVDEYANRTLRPVETAILSRYGAELGGRVLELGSGAGRLTGYLGELSTRVHGLELAADMVAYASARYPGIAFDQGDLRALDRYEDASFDAIIAPWNVLDVLGHAERLRILGEARRLLDGPGLLVFSTHNRAAAAAVPPPTRIRRHDPLRAAADVARMPRRVRNRRRVAAGQEEHAEYAIVNDSALDYSLLHYYIARDDQERQLAGAGFHLIECLDLDGRVVPPGAAAAECSELHYVARSRDGAR
jgi:SAM-dependent methyltransferase